MNEIEQPEVTHRSVHVAWLCCLYVAFERMRRQGLLALESDIEAPMDNGTIFHLFPGTLKAPYLDFATDLFRIQLYGIVGSSDFDNYAEQAIATLTFGNKEYALLPRFWRYPTDRNVDESLLRTIWVSIREAFNGHHPGISCEFGRQAIPFQKRLSFIDLEDLLQNLRRQLLERPHFEEGGLEVAAEQFITSLDKPGKEAKNSICSSS